MGVGSGLELEGRAGLKAHLLDRFIQRILQDFLDIQRMAGNRDNRVQDRQLSGAVGDFFLQRRIGFIQFCRHQVELVGQGFDLVARFHLNAVLELTRGHLLGGLD